MSKNRTPVIVGAARTPIGGFGGTLSNISAPTWAAQWKRMEKTLAVPAIDPNSIMTVEF